MPLWLAITMASVLLIALAAGLVGFLSYQNRRAAVDDLAARLSRQIALRIEEHLAELVATPHGINALNAALIKEGGLDPTDPAALQRVFLEEVRRYDSVTRVYFGNPAGGMAGSGRQEAGGALYLTETEGFRSGQYREHAAGASGDPGETIRTLPGFDARARPWYRRAVESGGAGWSDVYIPFNGQDNALAASRPVYGEAGELVGVLSVGLSLSHLGAFLRSLDLSATGVAFIVDRQGYLVASSTAESSSAPSRGAENLVRRPARDSTHPLVRSMTQALLLRHGSFGGVTGRQSLSAVAEGRRQLVEVVPFSDEYGVDWLIVVDVPESDFMSQVALSSRVTALGAGIALSLLAALVAVVAWSESRAIRDLAGVADDLGRGSWARPPRPRGVREVQDLTMSFASMAERLRESHESLQREVEERRQAEQALWDSRERLELALRGADLATWDWDVPSGRVVFSERWATMLGYSPSEIEPEIRSWERLLHPEDAAEARAALQAHLKGLSPAFRVTYRLLTKGGGWRWILDTGRVLSRDGGGRPLRAAGVHLDVSDHYRVTEELQRSNRRLQQTVEELRATQGEVVRRERLAAVGEVAAGITHVFNNVMTGIAGYAELIRNTRGTPDSAKEDASGILVQLKRAAGLVAQLQDLGRGATNHAARIDIAKVTSAIVREIEHSARPSLGVSYSPPSVECLVRGDETQLLQVVRNITRNALEAMPEGGELTVQLGRAVPEADSRCAVCAQPLTGEWVALSVSDTGGGFPPEVLPRLFEPFFTTKPLGEAAGLGLPQAGGIVEQHGGHITAANQDRGAKVVVYLPPAAVAAT